MGGIEGWARIVLWWLLGMPLHSSSFNINRVNINRTAARPHPLPVRTRDAVVECPRGSRLCLLRWTLRFRLVRKMQIFGL